MKRKWLFGVLAAALGCGVILANTFREQRVKFREEINLKVEEPMTKDGLINSVTFKNEKAWNFKVSTGEAAKLKPMLGDYFAVKDDSLLDRMVSDMNIGRFIVFKEYNKNSDGVNLKCAFLSPKVPYWKGLTDIGGIEKLFYVYNFSIVLGNKNPAETVVFLQTEGKYLGFGKSVTLPEYFRADDPNKTLNFRIATQAEALEMANKLPVLKPGRTSLQDRFVDLCRADPWYQEKDSSGNYVIPDKDILDLLDKDIIHKDAKCDVYASDGRWKVQEDISDNYLLVTYSLKTQVNIKAFIPPNIPFLGSMFKKVAQQVSDEVSAKYMPLSMKNFRDHTVEWAQTTH
jgi:hypothetical protein